MINLTAGTLLNFLKPVLQSILKSVLSDKDPTASLERHLTESNPDFIVLVEKIEAGAANWKKDISIQFKERIRDMDVNPFIKCQYNGTGFWVCLHCLAFPLTNWPQGYEKIEYLVSKTNDEGGLLTCNICNAKSELIY